ncbi:Hsp20/alpha crystallin family protein [Neobacillus sp. MM2021_6]|uniref:Hsp20/alpha crystallin family protein n=1 Tax=Bacillaceae TaxID=186817 RepID=UPI00140B783C|nr:MULTISPECIES: Hsp20/alpha crystallin family protein [Bacillaceae]MBO0962763.1 Hsp20/alpha crystallin family protein [Neobacillus sp. MM2021_6]NHC21179.1 Hsp20/alpha crystallin family protein [Bacillus sp. MM2020_4]
MDIEKLKQWMDVAQNMQDGEFWNNLFDQDFARQFLDEQQLKTSSTSKEKEANKKQPSTPLFPIIEIVEGESEVYIIIEVPGVKQEDIELSLARDLLTVKGTSNPIYSELNRTFSERFTGQFERQIKLPDKINPNQLCAKYWNGLLIVSHPRIYAKVEIIPIKDE